MNMIAVDSSNIAGIGWQGGELQVQFKSGTTYIYHRVPQGVWDEFQNAPSKGKFLHAEIKPIYPYDKL